MDGVEDLRGPRRPDLKASSWETAISATFPRISSDQPRSSFLIQAPSASDHPHLHHNHNQRNILFFSIPFRPHAKIAGHAMP